MNAADPGRSAAADHAQAADHDHRHDRWCGHPAVPHQDHVDYLHDGHAHKPSAEHVDRLTECDHPVGQSHLAHSGHMHVHAGSCGHDAVAHDDHVDYLHGRHRHAAHESHYDEH